MFFTLREKNVLLRTVLKRTFLVPQKEPFRGKVLFGEPKMVLLWHPCKNPIFLTFILSQDNAVML